MLTAIYAVSHFAVDLACAFAVFTACSAGSFGFLVYNFFAFAMQMPLGLLADKLNKNKYIAIFGVILVALVCFLPRFGLTGACLVGLGNGSFHVGGGLDVLNISGGRATKLGVFVSPGALGLYLGTLVGREYLPAIVILLALSSIAMLLIPKNTQIANVPVSLPEFHAFPVIAMLFLVVVLRSFGCMAADAPWKVGYWSTLAVCATVLGKAAGGIFADRFGAFRTGTVSLCAAALLYIPNHIPAAAVAAIFLFNMTMPITLSVVGQQMHGAKGFSFGLLTFALFLGYVPVYLGIGGLDGYTMAAVTLVSALLLLPVLRKKVPQ